MARRVVRNQRGRRSELPRESKCKTCGNVIFDEVFGEYKCKAHEVRLYNYDKVYECDEYKRNTKQ